MHSGGFGNAYAPLLSATLAARSSNALIKAMRDTDVNYYSVAALKASRRTGTGCGGVVHEQVLAFEHRCIKNIADYKSGKPLSG